MGKPIIATSISFHERLFEKGRCGVLVDDNTPETLACAITELYRNRERLRRMGETGREIVRRYYTWDNAAFEGKDFLENILWGSGDEKL